MSLISVTSIALGVYLLYILFYLVVGKKIHASVQFPLAGKHKEVSCKNMIKGIEIKFFEIDSGYIETWFLKQKSYAPCVLFYHGSGGTIDTNLSFARLLEEKGYHVLMVEYPSYGRSKGRLNNKSFKDIYLKTFDWLELNTIVTDIYILGNSMGGSIICSLINQRLPKALVLYSCHANYGKFISKKLLLPGIIIDNNFNNNVSEQARKIPTLIIHSKEDSIVPYSNALSLKGQFYHSELYTFSGGHGSLPDDELSEIITSYLNRFN